MSTKPADTARNGNRLTRREFMGLCLVSTVAFSLSGCGSLFSPENGDSDNESGTLRTYVEGEIPDLNSITATDLFSFSVLSNINEGLYRLDENERPVPTMAEDVEISDDQLLYTFTLRDGIQWSDGEPVTAEDFRYAWLRAMHPDTAGQYGYLIADFVEGGAELTAGEVEEDEVGIRATGDRNLEVRLINPTPFFLGLTALPLYFPLKQSFVEEQGQDFASGPRSLLFNGPYTLEEFNPSEGAVLQKNPDYWDSQNVAINTIDLRVVTESNTALNLYESGELDTVRLSSEQTDQYRDSPDFVEIPEFGSYYTVFNTENPALSNKNIRQALQLGFDREAYVQAVLGDASIPAGGAVPEGVSGPGGKTFREFAGDEPVGAFDPKAARELWQRGVGELGSDPSLQLLTSDNTSGRDTAIFLQGQYQENLGAEVEIDVQPFDAALERQQKGEFQIGCASGWGADYNDAMTFLDLWTSSSEFNLAAFQNDDYDRLIADARTEPDEWVRAGMLTEAERILLEEGAVLAPTHYRVRVGMDKARVQNPIRHPYGAELDFKYWKLS